MSKFYVGQKVVCINEDGYSILENKKVYTITEIANCQIDVNHIFL